MTRTEGHVLRLIEEHGTPTAVERSAGLAKGRIRRLTGPRKFLPTLDELLALATVLDVSAETLLLKFAADKGMPTSEEWSDLQRETAHLLDGLSPSEQMRCLNLLRVHLAKDQDANAARTRSPRRPSSPA